jgi:hypothetical protein
MKLSCPASARNIHQPAANDNLFGDTADGRNGMIVSAGEALVDLFPALDRDGGTAFRAAVNGSPCNVAEAFHVRRRRSAAGA